MSLRDDLLRADTNQEWAVALDAAFTELSAHSKLGEVLLLTDQNLSCPVGNNIMQWQVELYDDLNVHSLAVNTSRITAPAYATRVSIGFGLDTSAAPWIVAWTIELWKNGVFFSQFRQRQIPAGDYMVDQIKSPAWPTVAGDYWEINALTGGNTGVLVAGTTNYATFFSAEFFR
jgi:hypothetical protein